MQGVGKKAAPRAVLHKAAQRTRMHGRLGFSNFSMNSSAVVVRTSTRGSASTTPSVLRKRAGRAVSGGKKGSKKTRKYRMRGGANSISMGGTYAEFGGQGVGGLAIYEQGVKPGNPI